MPDRPRIVPDAPDQVYREERGPWTLLLFLDLLQETIRFVVERDGQDGLVLTVRPLALAGAGETSAWLLLSLWSRTAGRAFKDAVARIRRRKP